MQYQRPEGLGLDWVTIPKARLYLVVSLSAAAAVAAVGLVYFHLYGNPLARRPEPPAVPQSARVIFFEGDVHVFRAATREVVAVTHDTRLAPGDSLQTENTGRASLSLADGSSLSVTPDSVVQIADNSAAPDNSRSSVRVEVERGGIRLLTGALADGSTNDVKTPLADSRLLGQTAASFGVHPDHTEDIRVRAGRVHTTTLAGQSASITRGEYVALSGSGHVSRREALLDTPTPTEPADLAKIEKARGDRAAATLRWNPARATAEVAYEVEIARSPFFVADGILLDRVGLALPHLILNELRNGHHFWRVRATSPTGQTSEWSDPRRFTVTEQGGSRPAGGG